MRSTPFCDIPQPVEQLTSKKQQPGGWAVGAYRTTGQVTAQSDLGWNIQSVLSGTLSWGVVLPFAMAYVTNTLYANRQPWPSGNSAQRSVMGHFIKSHLSLPSVCLPWAYASFFFPWCIDEVPEAGREPQNPDVSLTSLPTLSCNSSPSSTDCIS